MSFPPFFFPSLAPKKKKENVHYQLLTEIGRRGADGSRVDQLARAVRGREAAESSDGFLVVVVAAAVAALSPSPPAAAPLPLLLLPPPPPRPAAALQHARRVLGRGPGGVLGGQGRVPGGPAKARRRPPSAPQYRCPRHPASG